MPRGGRVEWVVKLVLEKVLKMLHGRDGVRGGGGALRPGSRAAEAASLLTAPRPRC